MNVLHANPERQLIRLYAGLWVCFYWVAYFFFRDLTPDKYLRDADFIQSLAQGNDSPASDAFALTAYLLQLIPLSLSHFLVGLINGALIFKIIDQTRTYRGIFLTCLILPPIILLTMMAPTKESVVTLMAALILWRAIRAPSDFAVMRMIIIYYLLYGFLFRPYYLLILFFFIFYTILFKDKGVLRLLLPLTLVLAVVLMPESAFMQLEEPRDAINRFAGFGASYTVRTAFDNPFPPDGAGNFLLNYGFAFIRLNFPFFWDLTINEIALFANIMLYAWLSFTGLAHMRGPLRLLPILFVAHITVLLFFEPDLGSYFRHFSSVFLYLLPAFAFLENRRTALIAARYAPDAAMTS